MSWERSKDNDMRWAARKLVLDTMAAMDSALDALDPIGCRRYGEDRDGNPLHEDEAITMPELLFQWHGRLSRVNSILRELDDREWAREHGVEEVRHGELAGEAGGAGDGA